MILYNDSQIRIRTIRPEDVDTLTQGELAQGWGDHREKFQQRLEDHQSGKAIALVAEYRDQTAGYVSVYPNAQRGAFAGKGLPEIVDFGVLEKYRRRGVGSRLMDAAEQIASTYSSQVYLGVGLHSGYGSAQRMYCKRGYLPDGTGVWYQDRVCDQYAPCRNDDDLVLYLSKKLDRQPRPSPTD